TENLQKRFAAAFMPNYGVPPLAISRGQGCRVRDADGREYLDLIAGIAVSSLGHAHPAIVEAVSRQVAEVAHTSNLYLHEREIESGIGRTGAWFAHQAAGVRPDVLTLAKGLGGGLPIGMCVGLGAVGDGFARGDHGSTFGGNPVACAAALAVLDTIERDGLL